MLAGHPGYLNVSTAGQQRLGSVFQASPCSSVGLEKTKPPISSSASSLSLSVALCCHAAATPWFQRHSSQACSFINQGATGDRKEQKGGALGRALKHCVLGVARPFSSSVIVSAPLPQDGAGEERGKSPAAAGALGRATGQDLTLLLFLWDFAAGPSQQTINRCFVFVCLTATADLFCFLAVPFIEFSRIEARKC